MIELNGTTNGIAVMVTYNNTKRRRFLTNKGNGNSIRLFNNLKVAQTVVNTVTDASNIEYYIVIGDKKYPLSKAYKHNNSFKIIDNDTNKIITISEKTEYKANNFCYIVFENGDTQRCDKKYGQERTKELFKDIAQSIESSFVDNFDEFGIEYTEKYRSEYVVHLRGCTGAIHISTNANLMDINQCRKEEGDKVFPFIKDMDRYLTFYVYITRDMSEPIRINSEEKAFKQLQRIVEHLQQLDPEIDTKLVNVNYKSYICFNE